MKAVPSTVYTIRQVAAILRVSPALAARLARSGRLPSRGKGRDLRVPAELLESWILGQIRGLRALPEPSKRG